MPLLFAWYQEEEILSPKPLKLEKNLISFSLLALSFFSLSIYFVQSEWQVYMVCLCSSLYCFAYPCLRSMTSMYSSDQHSGKAQGR